MPPSGSKCFANYSFPIDAVAILFQYGDFFVAVEILLTPENLTLAEAEAVRRQEHNEARGLKGRNRAPSKGEKALKMHLLGCVGEVAVAEHLSMRDHLFSTVAPIRGSADLPGNIEIKTRSKHGYDLLIQFSDDPNKLVVLVTYEGDGVARIVGYIHGHAAMRREWIREFVRGRPCYAVPQKALKPIESIQHALIGKTSQEVVETVKCTLIKEGAEFALQIDKVTLDRLNWAENQALTCSFALESSQCLVRKADERQQKSD